VTTTPQGECSGPWKPESSRRLCWRRMLGKSEKARREFGRGRGWGGVEKREVSSRVTWDQGGRDPIMPRRVSKLVKGSRKGCKKGIGKGSKTRGLRHDYIIVNLYICMRGARYVRLIPWTLQSGSEQLCYIFALSHKASTFWRKLPLFIVTAPGFLKSSSLPKCIALCEKRK
jgi:hypothetical protein